MAARTPRRTFARPFVITLAAAPACYTSAPPPSQPPPPPAEQAPAPPPSPPPTTVIANPPRPMPPPAPPTPPPAPAFSDGTRWTIFKSKTGCEAAVKVECPKAEPGRPQPTCNPPPPRAYECPPNLTLDTPITIVATSGECFVEQTPVHCPPRVMCNPPPPRKVDCPK